MADGLGFERTVDFMMEIGPGYRNFWKRRHRQRLDQLVKLPRLSLALWGGDSEQVYGMLQYKSLM